MEEIGMSPDENWSEIKIVRLSECDKRTIFNIIYISTWLKMQILLYTMIFILIFIFFFFFIFTLIFNYSASQKDTDNLIPLHPPD